MWATAAAQNELKQAAGLSLAGRKCTPPVKTISFEDGKKLFKQTRNEVWREVRDEYKEQWKSYFADKDVREQDAEQHSGAGISRAMWFARSGDWDAARAAFDDRNAVLKAVGQEFSERRQELRGAQMSETRARQELACDELRASREEDYKALLMR